MLVAEIANGIMQLITGNASESEYNDAAVIAAASSRTTASGGQASAVAGNGAIAAGADYMAPWIDTPQCTSCDECVKLNPAIFQYNEQKKAVIKNPQGGPYKDLVKAAERCTAQIIHPGLPKERSEKDIEKWIARAEKYNR